MATIASPRSPALAGTPVSAQSPAPHSDIHDLALRPQQVKAVLVGASLAATLAVVAVVVVRARSRRGRHAPDTSSGVVGTIVKSALWAALQTVVQVGATRWAAKAMHRDPDHSPMVAAGD